MFNHVKFDQLAEIQVQAPTFLEAFKRLKEAQEFFQRPTSRKFRTLTIEQPDEYTIDVSYEHTSIRFQLLFVFESHRVAARVVCLHRYEVFEKVHWDILGDFTFNTVGQTSLPPTDRGEIRTIIDDADEIILAYLVRAVESGPRKLMFNAQGAQGV